MDIVELRDPVIGRIYTLQGLWFRRTAPPSAADVKPTLEWALEIASNGYPLPPLGFLADVGTLMYHPERSRSTRIPHEVPGWPQTLARSYEDHVLGKLDTDWSFERAIDACHRYTGRDRAKGLAYVIRQLRERAGLGGVSLSPALLRELVKRPGSELLSEGYDSLSLGGPLPLLLTQYEELVRGFRRLAETLGPEDVLALEHGTAVADLGQYVAHRQILTTAAALEARLPLRPVRPLIGRKEVPTRIHDEDQYPVGGYSSIATRGSIESLLQSQLAYMESEESPDLFDVKFVRDELFYYSRDENQFLRRRRTFVFAFFPELVSARFKDPDLPVQRIVLTLALVLALIRKLTEWLSDDALNFQIVFLQSNANAILDHEIELMRILLREPIERGSALVSIRTAEDFAKELANWSRPSQVHALLMSPQRTGIAFDGGVLTELNVDAPRPTLFDGHGKTVELIEDDAVDYWAKLAATVLRMWL